MDVKLMAIKSSIPNDVGTRKTGNKNPTTQVSLERNVDIVYM